MQQLSGNCRIGKISVYPQNWDLKKLGDTVIKSTWYIKYRFFDDNLHQSKQVLVKGGINEFHTLAEKQYAVQNLLDYEREQLNNGYNPITKKITQPQQSDASIVGPKTKFVERFTKS
ncbi:MAG: hypothetical protein LBE82_13575 [Chitinophagaceae bacterium]|jgi:hypothetical protein|nr:hypothetical protein [Chitinophagaceae bacterium]